MKKLFSQSEIGEIAQEILSGFTPHESATIVALSGDLGAGKTTLSQAIAKTLGVRGPVISPTFVIMKIYDLPKTSVSRYSRLVHIDAYRLNSSAELAHLGWAELAADPKNLILLEWPERVPECIPGDAHRIFLSHKNEAEREIDFS